MYVRIGCCRLNLSPPKCLALKYRHNSCPASVVRFLRLLASGIRLFAMYWFTLSLTLSHHEGEGIYSQHKFLKVLIDFLYLYSPIIVFQDVLC